MHRDVLGKQVGKWLIVAITIAAAAMGEIVPAAASGDVAAANGPRYSARDLALLKRTVALHAFGSGSGTVLGSQPNTGAVCSQLATSVVSTQQYSFPGSDGQTWADVDSSRLLLSSAPCTSSTGLITANADLFTSTSGVNQDIGIFVDVDGVPGATPVAWKESGGFAGTFSPDAAYVQAIFAMLAGHSYNVHLKWKAAKATPGTILAGAGPISPGSYSPTRLTLQLRPTPPGFASMTAQQVSHGSDGTMWTPIPGLSPLTLLPSASSRVIFGGNADLWTDTAGYNQDIGIFLSGGAIPPPGQLLAWKESGGTSTYAPNAAFVQTTANLAAGSYSATLVWKTNHAAPSTSGIYVGAGPLPSTSTYSPTSLSAVVLPAGPNPYESVVNGQGVLCCSNGSTWITLGGPAITVEVSVTPATNTNALATANADLWTSTVGYNQDIAIFVTDNGSPGQLLVWKESGGGGRFSPNAAFAETMFPMLGGHTYVFTLYWKTNRNASVSGALIYAGAGQGQISPTRLSVEEVP